MQAARDILSYPDTVRRGQRSSVSIPLSIALLAAGLSGISLSPASAQTAVLQANPQPAAHGRAHGTDRGAPDGR